MIHRKLLPPNPPLLFIRASSVPASIEPPWVPGNTNVFSSDIMIKFFRSHDIVTTEAKLYISNRQTYHYRKKRYVLNNQASTRKDITKIGGCIPAPSLFYEREVSIPACFDAKINKKFKIGLPNRIFRNTSLHITFVIVQNLPSYSTKKTNYKKLVIFAKTG